MESSWIRDQTHVSCLGRWILIHWATREAPYFFLMLTLLQVWSVGTSMQWLLGLLLFDTNVSGVPYFVCAPSPESDISQRFLLVGMILRSLDLDPSYPCSWAVAVSLSSSEHARNSTHMCTHTHVVLFIHNVCVCVLSCVRLFVTPWIVACQALPLPWNFPGKNTGVGCYFLVQGIFKLNITGFYLDSLFYVSIFFFSYSETLGS